MSSAAVEQPDAEHGHFEVPVRTPAGASHHFAVRPEELVATVVAAAIAYFVGKNELAAGDYGLAVIRDGQAEPMADTSRLSEYGITDQDVLVLVPEAPQVDG
jgi:hypothetical protein